MWHSLLQAICTSRHPTNSVKERRTLRTPSQIRETHPLALSSLQPPKNSKRSGTAPLASTFWRHYSDLQTYAAVRHYLLLQITPWAGQWVICKDDRKVLDLDQAKIVCDARHCKERFVAWTSTQEFQSISQNQNSSCVTSTGIDFTETGGTYAIPPIHYLAATLKGKSLNIQFFYSVIRQR